MKISARPIRIRVPSLCCLLVASGLAGALATPLGAAGPASAPQVLAPLPPLAAAQAAAAQASAEEEIAIMWEIEGDGYCSYVAPEGIDNGFQFNDGFRWLYSATNPGTLAQGDPMTLTWGFIRDTTSSLGVGFTCNVGGETSGTTGSDLIAFLDGLHGVGSGGTDLTNRPWFPIFQNAFDNWGALNGINYLYEPADDGANAGQSGAAGVLGVRADLRIGGHFIDGQAGPNVLACNYFPENGDMILDTGNSSFYSPDPPEHRGFRNVLEHEHGHGLAFRHVCPLVQTKLMEPFVSLSFLGAQEDDILAANRGYGDRNEFPAQNDTSGTATSLGAIAAGNSVMRTTLSIDGTTDQDFYSFSAPAGVNATVTLAPTGSSYLQGPQTPMCDNSGTSTFNALIESNLGVELRGQSGANVLAVANSAGPGVAETITDAALSEGAGTYFVRAFGADDKAQMYDLTVALSLPSEADLSITKTDSADPAISGTNLAYTITVTNAGPGVADDVVVTESLPAGVAFVSTSGCSPDPGNPNCNLDSIAAGASKQYTVTVQVTAMSGTLTNNVSVVTSTTDPNAGNNATSEQTAVSQIACGAADQILTSADNMTADGYLAKTSVTTGNDFAVGAAESVQFVAGNRIQLDDNTTIGGIWSAAIQPGICP